MHTLAVSTGEYNFDANINVFELIAGVALKPIGDRDLTVVGLSKPICSESYY